MIKRSLIFLIFSLALGFSNPALFPRIPRVSISGGSYTAIANDWDGSDDGAERDADLDTNSDGKQLTVSVWVKFDNTNGTQAIFNNTGDRLQIQKQPEGFFRVRALNAAGVTILNIEQDPAKVAVLTTATWYHLLASADLGVAGTRYLYVNNTEALNTSTITFTDDTIDFTVADHAIQEAVGGGFHHNGCETEYWIGYRQVIDFSVGSNRQKFINGGVPVDLGAAGATPTGTSPSMYFKGDYNGVSTGGTIANSGTGGNFLKKGAGSLTACSNHP